MLLLCSGLCPHLHTNSGSSHTCPSRHPSLCSQSDLPPSHFPVLDRGSLALLPAHAQHQGLAVLAALGLVGWGHLGLLADLHPKLVVWRAFVQLSCLSALTIGPFKVPHTPRLGATTRCVTKWTHSALCRGTHARGKGEQMSYSLLRDLVGLGSWYAAH